MRRAAVAVLALALVAGCGEAAEKDATEAASPEEKASTASAEPTTSAEPWAPLGGELGRCGPQPPRLADQDFRTLTLRAPGRRLPAVTTGRGRTVVVLVHQTDGGGFCGWLDFAARIAEVPGQTALAFDLCGYGDSDCADGSSTLRNQVAQVRLAVDAAQRRLHARRIVVVGASMGGALTVLAAARDSRIDAAVDLSGPDTWNDASVHTSARGVRVPLLVAMAQDEGPQSMAEARATAEAAAQGELVTADAGHGYELLVDQAGEPTPIAERVLALIAG